MPFTIEYDHPTEGPVIYNGVTKLEGVWNKYGKLTHYRLFTGRRATEHRHFGFVKLDRVLSVEAELPEIDHGAH